MTNAFLVNSKNNYFYKFEAECMFPYRFRPTRPRVLQGVLHRLRFDNFPELFLNGSVLNASKIIFTDAAFNSYLYKSLQKYVGKENMYLYYMNLIDVHNLDFMKWFSGRSFSFDWVDANRYGIAYRHLPYSSHIQLPQSSYEYDTVFLARQKGRLEEVKKAGQVFETCGLKARIMLLDSDDPKYKIPAYISYTDYLKYVARSRSILEINAGAQTSCTYRFLESLFLKKKLVTNNRYIQEDPYFDHNNVFILGIDDIRKLPDFVAQPYRENDMDLTDLTFENWIQNW